MLYNKQYRVESARLREYDYSICAWYYVTINVFQHQELLGFVQNNIMLLNDLGEIVQSEWLAIPRIRTNVGLDEFIIMPNHMHGIVIIEGNKAGNNDLFKNDKQNLSNIIRGFKGSVTSKIHKLGLTDFQWQPRFYDRVIRNERELFYIRQYIEQNPLKWDLSEELPDNLY